MSNLLPAECNKEIKKKSIKIYLREPVIKTTRVVIVAMCRKRIIIHAINCVPETNKWKKKITMNHEERVSADVVSKFLPRWFSFPWEFLFILSKEQQEIVKYYHRENKDCGCSRPLNHRFLPPILKRHLYSFIDVFWYLCCLKKTVW